MIEFIHSIHKDSSPQSDMANMLDLHDINLGTLVSAAPGMNDKEEAAAEEEPNHPEIIVISDDESPTEEGGGVETSQPQVNQRGVVRDRWTISEDCTLVKLICGRRLRFVWKCIAAEIPGRSSNSCRLRWKKLMDYDDQYTSLRWSYLARFLPEKMTRDYVFNHWRHHVMTKRRHRLSVAGSVDHPVGANSSGQNVQDNEGIISRTQIVGPIITYPILGQGNEVITSDENVDENTSMALATTSSNPSFLCASVELDLNLPLLDPQTSSITFYDFLGDKSY